MKISILSPQHFHTSQWSGGSSTQLYIFPANASYAARDFELRLSTAKVEVAESTFTALSSVDRKLMILEGAITISHEGRGSKQLNADDRRPASGVRRERVRKGVRTYHERQYAQTDVIRNWMLFIFYWKIRMSSKFDKFYR